MIGRDLVAAKRKGLDLEDHHHLVEVLERSVGLHRLCFHVPLQVQFGHM
jgi:hypothetical protein